MSTAVVAISRACNNACRFCEVAATLDRRAIPADALRARIDAAIDGGARTVTFTGGEPTLSAALFKALAYTKGRGARTSLSTNARLLVDPEKVGRLVAAGLDEVSVAIHGADAATHDALVGAVGAFTETSAALATLSQRFTVRARAVLTRSNVGQIEAIARRAADAGAVAFELRRLRPSLAAPPGARELAPSAAEEHEAAERVLRGVTGLPVALTGFDGSGLSAAPCQDPRRPMDEVDLRLLREGVLTPALLGGLGAPPEASLRAEAARRGLGADDLIAVWAAAHVPLRDAPASAGGLGPLDAPQAPTRPLPQGVRIAVVNDRADDPLWSASILPGLAAALRRRGHDPVVLSPYTTPFDPERLDPPRGLLAGLLRRGHDPLRPDEATRAAAATVGDALRAQPGAPLRVVASWATRTRLSDLAVTWHVPDDDLLRGFAGALGPDDVVRSPYPGSAPAYALAGVDLRQVSWRPLPLHLGHLPTTAPSEGRGALVLGTLDQAPRAPVIPWPDDLPGQLAALARCRVVVVGAWPRKGLPPVRALSLALGAGRPVVGPDVPALWDHVRDGAEGSLVRPGAPGLIAATIDALHEQPARCDQLGAAARARARRWDVDAWAAELLDGAPARRVVPLAPERGPWTPW